MTTMKIASLQDMLKYHQSAVARHQALHHKHGVQHAKYPKWAERIQRADQTKIDHHQQQVDVLQEAIDRIKSLENELLEIGELA